MIRLAVAGLCGVVALLASYGCGGSPDRSDAVHGGAGSRQGATTGPGRPAAAVSVDLTDARLEALERGLRAEAGAVRDAQARALNATTPQERGEALQAAFEDATLRQGAEAAGMPQDAYRQLRTAVTDTLRTLDYQGKIEGPLSVDLSRVDAATRDRLSRDPLAALSPAAADALRRRMGSLVPVWLEYVRLTAVAG